MKALETPNTGRVLSSESMWMLDTWGAKPAEDFTPIDLCFSLKWL